MKLEDFKTINLQHSKQADARYNKKKPNSSCVEPRREDCEKDKDGCIDKDERKGEGNYEKYENYQYSNFKIGKDTTTSSKIEETYERTGDEFYIPLEINEYILNNTIQENNIITNVVDNNTIHLYSDTVHTINLDRVNKEGLVYGGMRKIKLTLKKSKTRKSKSRNSVKIIYKGKTKMNHQMQKLMKQK